MKELEIILNDQKALVRSILIKVHAAGGGDAVNAFIDSKGSEMPPVKLSSREMECLKGGSLMAFLSQQSNPTHVHNGGCSMGGQCPSLWDWW